MQLSARIVGSILVLCFVITLLVWSVVLGRDENMRISIAQSGASVVILIKSPTNKSILIGGGSDASVLRVISSMLPWYQHSLDAVVLPQIDAVHAGGSIDVLRRYQTPLVFMQGAAGKGAEWVSLLDELYSLSNTTQKTQLLRGQILDMGGGSYMHVLFPDRYMPHADSRTACSPIKIVYGTTSVLVLCDINPVVLPYLSFLDGHELAAQILVLPESLFKSNNVKYMLGFSSPQDVIVTHACTLEIASTTLRSIKKFNISAIDPCKHVISVSSDGEEITLTQ
jgi:beta-lactamase superfamily II metal-dependent hydrolase